MAFDSWEFFRGAFAAFVLFVVIHQIALLGHGLQLLLVVLPLAVATLVLGSLPAWMIGRLLRHRAQMWIHLLAFAAFGAAIGYVMTFAGFGFWTGLWSGPENALLLHVFVLSSTIAVPLGWWLTARYALAADRR